MAARTLRTALPLFVLSALLTAPAAAQSDFIRGDANGSGAVDIADAIYSLDHLFLGGPALCRDAIDSNDDGLVNLADPIHSLAYQFSGGPAPGAPFPACGDDPTADPIECLGPVPACPTGTPPTAFRFTSIEIRDPHIFTTFLICVDSTATVNGLILGAMEDDADADGILDQSFLLVFRPLDPAGSGGSVDFLAAAECSSPVAGTSCDVGLQTVTVNLTHTNPAAGTCLVPVPGTTTAGWTPAIAIPTSPCFVTAPTSLTLDLAGIPVALENAQLAGEYVGAPVTSIADGLGFGFISQTVANQTILPPTLPLVGGLPLSALLPGGAGNCSSTDARDTGPDGVTLGWWIYFNYTAVEVPYTGP